MEPIITAKKIELTSRIRSHASHAVNNLGKFFNNIVSAEFILSKEKFRYQAELKLGVYRETISAKGEADDLFAAIDICVDRGKAQLLRYKSKLKDKDPSAITKLSDTSSKPATDAVDD